MRSLRKKKAQMEIDRWKRMSDKHLDLFFLMVQWVTAVQNGKDIGQYLKEKKYQTAAIYGMSYVGECLLRELNSGGIEVKYGIDRKKRESKNGLQVISPDEELKRVDVVIVTAISSFGEIQEMLMEKTDIPVISLTDILLELSVDQDGIGRMPG